VNVRVGIADDQQLVRAGFRKILEAEDGIEVMAEASTGLEAIAAARHHQPDLVLMDIRMPDMDALEATRRLLASDPALTRVLILPTFDLDEYVYQALHAGASGFLLKDSPPDQLAAAVRIIVGGTRCWRLPSRARSSRSSPAALAGPSSPPPASMTSPPVNAKS